MTIVMLTISIRFIHTHHSKSEHISHSLLSKNLKIQKKMNNKSWFFAFSLHTLFSPGFGCLPLELIPYDWYFTSESTHHSSILNVKPVQNAKRLSLHHSHFTSFSHQISFFWRVFSCPEHQIPVSIPYAPIGWSYHRSLSFTCSSNRAPAAPHHLSSSNPFNFPLLNTFSHQIAQQQSYLYVIPPAINTSRWL